MSSDFTYHRQGRNRRTAISITLIWLGLLFIWIGLEAAPWIVLLLGLFTLPAVWDYVTDPPSGLSLSDDQIHWHSGKREASVGLDEIELVRLDTRLDFSVRVTLVLKTGAKVRLPFESTPPDQPMEEALNARGVATRRTHFQLMQ